MDIEEQTERRQEAYQGTFQGKFQQKLAAYDEILVTTLTNWALRNCSEKDHYTIRKSFPSHFLRYIASRLIEFSTLL